MADFNVNDIRAAVAANVITEKQATQLKVIAEDRLGYRVHMKRDDEPFELFSGFAEIFVTVGLTLLFSGVLAFTAIFGGGAGAPFIACVFSFLFAWYFTKVRRMNLPSIWLATVFGVNITAIFVIVMFDPFNPSESLVLYAGLIGMAAMLGWFWLFKLPFAMFLFGCFGLVVALSLAAIASPNVIDFFSLRRGLFDLNNETYFPMATLLFGIVTFILAMFFDTKDPYRVSRFSASGFWLHVLAAVSIVNTVGMTLYNSGGAFGYSMTAIALFLISLVALIIDRRSFLTAGILYMAVLLYAAFEGEGDGTALVLTLLILGIFITILGTWWAQIRSALMKSLPNFPFKNRLPPYLDNA